ncbi:MAG: hypothetical protein IJP07_07580, partial [Firmicutes bacterium]|nr:hypothetical protein [Bacillota bacterium]
MKKQILSILLILLLSMGLISTAMAVGGANGSSEAPESIELFEKAYISSSDLELDGFPSEEELFAGYVQKLMDESIYGDSGAFFGRLAREQLDDFNKLLYDELLNFIEEVAAGERSSTRFEITLPQEIVDSELTVSGNGQEELVSALSSLIETKIDLSLLSDALLYDHPYELYWHDKTGGADKMNAFGYSYGMAFSGHDGNDYTSGKIASLGFFLEVSPAYQAAGYSEEAPAVDTAKTGAASQLIVDPNDERETNVEKALAAAAGCSTDYEKIMAFAQWICDSVEYNYDAADDDWQGGYGDPWQLIYVFDGLPGTKVVCEGYSKAFQYLCDLAGIECYSVSGRTGENHMWNIVRLNGQSYIVDVTNSDAGSIGHQGGELLVGYASSGSVAEGYTISVSSTNAQYIYNEDMKALWGSDDSSILKLATAEYEEPEIINYTITATASPTEGGTVSGAGSYEENADVTLTATANEGYEFVEWQENGSQLSTDASISFTAMADRTLVAIFEKQEPPVVSLTKGDGEAEYYTTLGAAVTAAGSCVAADAAVLTLLDDIDLGEDYQGIGSGVFTLDLNGFDIICDSFMDAALAVYNAGTVLSITDSSQEKSSEVRDINIYAGTVNIGGGTFDGVIANGGNVNITGGSFDGMGYGLYVYSGTITLSLPEGGGDGATFPGGITVSGTTLNAILGEGAAYWQGNKMIILTADATEITGGDVTIKKACDHSGNTNESGTDNEDGTHSISCSECSVEIQRVFHEYGESGICGVCENQAVASLTKDGGTPTYFYALDAALNGASSCTAADEAVLSLLDDIDLGEDYQGIGSGVFALDLNGFDIICDSFMDAALAVYNAGTVLSITDSSQEKSSEVRDINIYAGTVNISGGTFDGVIANGGTVNITGGSFDGMGYGLYVYSGTITLGLPEGGGDGATFPGGITVSGTTLNAILGEGAAYWQGNSMITPADDATSISGGDVVIKAAPPTYSVSISDSIANGSVTADKEKAVEGEQVKLTVEPDDGYLLDSLSVSGGITPVQNGEFTYVFNMPANAVEVSATFKTEIPTITLSSNREVCSYKDSPTLTMSFSEQ